MAHVHSVSTHFVEEVLRSCEELGYLPEPHFTSLLSEDRVSLYDFCMLLDNVRAHTGRDDIGLLLGQMIKPSCFNVLGHLVMACRTVGEALPLVQQFQDLVIDGLKSKTCCDEEVVNFSWTSSRDDVEPHRQLIDLILSATRSFGRWATGIEEPFTAVFFQYPQPDNTELCQQVFGHPGRYDKNANGFSLPLAWMDYPIKSASDNIKPLIVDHARQALNNIKMADNFIDQLSQVISSRLELGAFTIEQVAQELEISKRTLQRKLHAASTSYSEVLQEVRFKEAKLLLTTTQLNLTEIALRLGYREQSSFSSAYKSWTGLSPTEFREQGQLPQAVAV